MAPLTYAERVELLKKAREAKKNKKLAKSAPAEPLPEVEEEIVFEEQEEVEPPKRTRSKSVKPKKRPEPRTLDIKEPEKMPDFVDGAIDMIANNDRVNNEFYTCPVYNYCIAEGQKIKIYNIDFEAMHGLGTPEDLTLYLEKHA